MKNIPALFGSMVFNDEIMKERLPKETYRALQRTIDNGRSLDKSIADVVANAMKDWAIEKGATHFTHWFQPMTGVTAELYRAGRQARHNYGILRQGARQGRAGRVQFPFRGPARHL